MLWRGDMNSEHAERVEYKGYVIVAAPVIGAGECWYSGYQIMKNGRTVSARDHIFPGFFYFDPALTNSIEYAKMEIDYRPS
jgi:hypothetical protein